MVSCASRFPLFPQAVATFQIPFMILGAIAIVYGAWVAMVQPDIKKLVAYSSVSHMGYVIVGLFSLNAIAATRCVLSDAQSWDFDRRAVPFGRNDL